MAYSIRWRISEEDKKTFIRNLTRELTTLRSKAGISQEELSALIGVSRQTYGSIERGLRKMSWGTFLSLVFFYDYNERTHNMIRAIGAFPIDAFKQVNKNDDGSEISLESFMGNETSNILDVLDEQALHAIRTVIMLEYARCTATPGDTIVKSFDGVQFVLRHDEDYAAASALKAIKEGKA